MLKKIKTSKPKVILLIIILTLLIGVLLFSLMSNKSDNTQNGQGEQNGDYISLDPPTQQDKETADNNKHRIVEQNEQIKSNQSSQINKKQSIKPIISMAQQSGQAIEVSAYIPGIFEDGGECRALFSKSGISFSKSSTGVKEGRNVYCPLISVNTSEFTQKGEWSVKLLYESSFYVGSSEETKFNVN